MWLFKCRDNSGITLPIFLIAACGQQTTTQPTQPSQPSIVEKTSVQEELAKVEAPIEPAAVPTETTSEKKIFVLTGENFKFKLDGKVAPDLVVNEGDTVRIEFTSTSGFHDWTISEFDAATKRVNSGESTFVEFVADKKGTFEYFCSVGSHRSLGMKGNLIVQ